MIDRNSKPWLQIRQEIFKKAMHDAATNANTLAPIIDEIFTHRKTKQTMPTKPTTYSVYHLIDPNTRTVKYIGKSTNPAARHRQHIQESQERQNTAKKQWIHQLLSQNQQPILITVASYPTEPQARARESRECHQHKNTILNIHDPAKGAKDLHQNKTPK